MVNEKMPNIESIITILKKTDKPVSGETIAEALGISRVAVWKMINKLKDEGYNIESGRTGYRLKAVTDKPLPWELDRPNENIRYFNELDSTMTKAEILIDSGCSDGTTIIAGKQTSGISREGGNWKSPEGGLYFTRVKTSPLPLCLAGLYCTAIASAAADVLKNLFEIKAEVRWPNEVTADGEKLCGVLTRFSGELNSVSSISTGIGVNVNISDKDLPPDAASIMQITGHTVSIKLLLSHLLEAMEDTDSLFSIVAKEQTGLIIEKCKQNMETLGREIIVTAGSSEICGTAVDLDSTGALILRTEQDKIITIYSGEDYCYV
jgi:BirA family biotin operon repressor/biotin-[acetyl-CoA-carboxylase] ligase